MSAVLESKDQMNFDCLNIMSMAHHPVYFVFDGELYWFLQSDRAESHLGTVHGQRQLERPLRRDSEGSHAQTGIIDGYLAFWYLSRSGPYSRSRCPHDNLFCLHFPRSTS